MTKRQIAEFSLDWVEIPPDYTKCASCDQLLIGKMFVPLVGIGSVEELNMSEVALKLCNVCYEIHFKFD